MTAAAPTEPVADAAPGAPALDLGRVADAISRALRPEATALDRLVLYGATAFGDAILAAPDPEMMDEALEEVAWDRRFLDYIDYLRAQARESGRNRPTEEAVRGLTSVVGERFELKVREYARLVQVGLDALRRMPDDFPFPRRMPVAMADRLYDLAAPRDYIDCVVGELRSDAAQLALVRGATSGVLKAWQAVSLIEFSCAGVRRHLRLVADYGVPEDVVPAAERVSWQQVVREWDNFVDKLDEINQAADATGAAVYPVFPNPDVV